MTARKLLGLPPISAQLKPIIPYLQRAEELRKTEPIIAYWCAYYAAQVGINQKARDNDSRDVLFNLLDVLEHMKNDIGRVDAIEIEAASAAFVENFALKVFHSADDEDRRGAASRLTAKKFLAAANFLEVLRTFPKAEVSDSNEDKIRYAKWKAADISKALREGRKPVPGPAGKEQEQLQTEDQPLLSLQTTTSPPLDRVEDGNQHFLHQTPTASHSPPHGLPVKSTKEHRRDGSGSSTHSGSGKAPYGSKKAWVSDDVEGKLSPSSSPPRPSAMKTPGREASPEGKKQVHFSSSADIVPSIPELPPKNLSPAEVYRGPSSIYAASPEKMSPSPPQIPQVEALPSVSYSSPQKNIYSPPAYLKSGRSHSPPKSYPATVPPPPVPISSLRVELTPEVIGRAQKHCRFAISSLDYEDAEQAKKELRTALALLGGL